MTKKVAYESQVNALKMLSQTTSDKIEKMRRESNSQ